MGARLGLAVGTGRVDVGRGDAVTLALEVGFTVATGFFAAGTGIRGGVTAAVGSDEGL